MHEEDYYKYQIRIDINASDIDLKDLVKIDNLIKSIYQEYKLIVLLK